MSEAVTLDSFRARIATHMAGGATLPAVAQMAFGDGGHDAAENSKPVPASRTALFHERLRKPCAAIVQISPTEVQATAYIDEAELVGAAISEAALVDTAGNLIAMKTFAPKHKESDERIEIKLTLRF
jgi:phage-related tail fiber protein